MISIRAKDINKYIREAMGRKFSAKDFRTWSGTLLCACALARQGIDPSEKPRGRKRKIIAAIEETAAALGNTPAVSRDSYICPSVITAFEKGRIITDYFGNAEKLIHYRGIKLHKAEKSLLRLLKEETS
jgi:DNA topoisomerase-1